MIHNSFTASLCCLAGLATANLGLAQTEAETPTTVESGSPPALTSLSSYVIFTPNAPATIVGFDVGPRAMPDEDDADAEDSTARPEERDEDTPSNEPNRTTESTDDNTRTTPAAEDATDRTTSAATPTASEDEDDAITSVATEEDAEATEAGRWVLVRVVGPSLAEAGATDPLAQPDAIITGPETADVRRLGYEHRAFAEVVYEDGTTPQGRFLEALETASEAVNALPVTLPETDEDGTAEATGDVVDLIELQPGAYSLMAFPRVPGSSGVALIEVFALPADFDPELTP